MEGGNGIFQYSMTTMADITIGREWWQEKHLEEEEKEEKNKDRNEEKDEVRCAGVRNNHT